MYNIDVDVYQKLIRIVISGKAEYDEVLSYKNALFEIMNRLNEKEYVILASMERLDPLPQDCLPLAEECMKIIKQRAKMAVEVHKRVVTQMQMQKIERRTMMNMKEENIIRCHSMSEAEELIYQHVC